MTRIHSPLQALSSQLIRISLSVLLFLQLREHWELGELFDPMYLSIEVMLLMIILLSDYDTILVDKENFIFQEGHLFNSKIKIPLSSIRAFQLTGKVEHHWQEFLALPLFRFLGFQTQLHFTLFSGEEISIYTSMPTSKLKSLHVLLSRDA